jgi:hypothetical protein
MSCRGDELSVDELLVDEMSVDGLNFVHMSIQGTLTECEGLVRFDFGNTIYLCYKTSYFNGEVNCPESLQLEFPGVSIETTISMCAPLS